MLGGETTQANSIFGSSGFGGHNPHSVFHMFSDEVLYKACGIGLKCRGFSGGEARYVELVCSEKGAAGGAAAGGQMVLDITFTERAHASSSRSVECLNGARLELSLECRRRGGEVLSTNLSIHSVRVACRHAAARRIFPLLEAPPVLAQAAEAVPSQLRRKFRVPLRGNLVLGQKTGSRAQDIHAPAARPPRSW
jgi:hypothetical protein